MLCYIVKLASCKSHNLTRRKKLSTHGWLSGYEAQSNTLWPKPYKRYISETNEYTMLNGCDSKYENVLNF